MAMAGAVVMPVGIILSSVFAGWSGFAGALVGFGLASLNTLASLAIIRWALKKPPEVIPWVLISTMWGRLIVLAVAIVLLTMVSALDKYALLFCFLALFLSHSAVEIATAWSSAKLLLKAHREE